MRGGGGSGARVVCELALGRKPTALTPSPLRMLQSDETTGDCWLASAGSRSARTSALSATVG